MLKKTKQIFVTLYLLFTSIVLFAYISVRANRNGQHHLEEMLD